MRLNKAGADNRPCFIFKYFSKLSSHSDTRSYQAVTPLLLFASIFPTASPSHPDVQFPLLPSPRNRQNQFQLPGNHCPLYLHMQYMSCHIFNPGFFLSSKEQTIQIKSRNTTCICKLPDHLICQISRMLCNLPAIRMRRNHRSFCDCHYIPECSIRCMGYIYDHSQFSHSFYHFFSKRF